MSPRLSEILSPERALIFRITHVENVPWVLRNGLWCANGESRDPNFISIGNPDLIEKRPSRLVGIPPGGTLADYVPFYFTPRSQMLLNILTGWNGIKQRSRDEIVIFVASLRQLEASGIPFVFSDRHAYLKRAEFYSTCEDLHAIDFDPLRRSDFKYDPEDPEKVERYQAEALVHRYLAIENLTGLGCYTAVVKQKLDKAVRDAGADLRVEVRPEWLFG